MMRLIGTAAVAALWLGSVTALGEPVPYLQKPVVVFRTLPFVADTHPVNPDVRYVGGYELAAQGTSLLTGLSDIQVFPEDDHLRAEAVSDSGAVASFDLKPQGDGLADSPLQIDMLRDAGGNPFYDKFSGDSEDIAYDPATRDRYVSFEGNQRIMKYAAADAWRGKGEILPLTSLPKFQSNFGMEGLAYIREPGGDSLLIGVEAGGFWDCALSDYRCVPVKGPPVPGFMYMLTSLAVLDYSSPAIDHEIMALYRYYDPLTGPRNILSLLRLQGDRKHGLRLVREGDLLKVAPPLPADNYEGVAALRIDGGYRLYLISDGLQDADKPKMLVFEWKR